MISTISQLGIGAGIIAVGAVGHELTHAVVGKLLGGRVLMSILSDCTSTLRCQQPRETI